LGNAVDWVMGSLRRESYTPRLGMSSIIVCEPEGL